MTAMRAGLICTVLVLFCLGCGYNPDKPVYNTKSNPEGYPPRALLLLDRLHSGELETYDEIITNFAELYEAHTELLDNQQWLQVVSRLGVRFRYQADQLAEQGISKYGEAAKLYTLAAFARPDDERLQHRRLLFSSWDKAVTDSVIPADFNPDTNPLQLPQQLRVLRYFVLSDSTSRQFAEEFLVPRLLNVHAAETALKNASSQQGLTVADKCFLTTLGFKYRGPEQVLASFTEPAIDLVATKVSSETSGWYGTELYFVPRESVMVDYSVALRVRATNPLDSVGVKRWLAFDFHPLAPSSTWKPNEIVPAYRRFILAAPIQEIAVGLFQTMPDSAHFVRLRDTGESFFVLPPATFADR